MHTTEKKKQKDKDIEKTYPCRSDQRLAATNGHH
jgi:hypothetical protein